MAYVSDILYIFGNFICFSELLHFVMQSAIFNVLQANLLAKERLINQHVPTQIFRSSLGNEFQSVSALDVL